VKPSKDIARLIEIMAALRTPGSGCPWDLEQTFRTIAPYTLEEAYEVADEHDDVATASLLENFIDEAEKRCWFLFEASRGTDRSGH
jgi:NTP pyrophosphatase (non-canonical NTP hydrolase)